MVKPFLTPEEENEVYKYAFSKFYLARERGENIGLCNYIEKATKKLYYEFYKEYIKGLLYSEYMATYFPKFYAEKPEGADPDSLWFPLNDTKTRLELMRKIIK